MNHKIKVYSALFSIIFLIFSAIPLNPAFADNSENETDIDAAARPLALGSGSRSPQFESETGHGVQF